MQRRWFHDSRDLASSVDASRPAWPSSPTAFFDPTGARDALGDDERRATRVWSTFVPFGMAALLFSMGVAATVVVVVHTRPATLNPVVDGPMVRTKVLKHEITARALSRDDVVCVDGAQIADTIRAVKSQHVDDEVLPRVVPMPECRYAERVFANRAALVFRADLDWRAKQRVVATVGFDRRTRVTLDKHAGGFEIVDVKRH